MATKTLNTGEKTYVPNQKENKFKQSQDPELPYKAMGTYWGILIGLMVALSAALLFTYRHRVTHPPPPNLLLDVNHQ
jgi:hypothetical protein